MRARIAQDARLTAVLLVLCLLALAGCTAQPIEWEHPTPTISDAPQATPVGEGDAPELEELPLPEGYAQLVAPPASGATGRDIAHIEYEDMATEHNPAFDFDALPDRLWRQGGYEEVQLGEGNYFTFEIEGGQEQTFYWDFRHAYYESGYSIELELTLPAEKLKTRTESYLTEILGTVEYLSHPQEMDDSYYLRNNIAPDENNATFIYDQVADGIPVFEHNLNAVAMEDGVISFALNWGALEPTDAPLPDTLLSAEQAAYSLNHARSQSDELLKYDGIIHAQLVFCPHFTHRTNLYRPAWKFVLTDAQTSVVDTIFVDLATGDVYSDRFGRMGSAYPTIASNSLEKAVEGIDSTTAEAMLTEYIHTAWGSLHTLKVPELPLFALETVENTFNYLWTEYRIELIKSEQSEEQAQSPPVVRVTAFLDEVSVDGILVRVPYEFTVQLNSEEFEKRSSAVFVFKDGNWMLKSAGEIWNGEEYVDALYKVWRDGPISEAQDAVRGKIEGID